MRSILDRRHDGAKVEMFNKTIQVIDKWLEEDGLRLSLSEYTAINAVKYFLNKIHHLYSNYSTKAPAGAERDYFCERKIFSDCSSALSESLDIARLTETVLLMTRNMKSSMRLLVGSLRSLLETLRTQLRRDIELLRSMKAEPKRGVDSGIEVLPDLLKVFFSFLSVRWRMVDCFKIMVFRS